MSMIMIDPEGDVVLKFGPALIVIREQVLGAWAETASLVGMHLSYGSVSHDVPLSQACIS
jgi:hypothetical protein